MRTITGLIEALNFDLASGRWSPSAEERVAAAAVAELPELETIPIRIALAPAYKMGGRYVTAMESVASVLDLPVIHQEKEDRTHLLDLVIQLTREVVNAN